MLGKTKNPGGQSAPQKNKYLVIALLCLPFVLCLYLIFGGSGEQAPAAAEDQVQAQHERQAQ